MIQVRVVYVSQGKMLAARGNKILESRDGGATWEKIAEVPVPWWGNPIMSLRLPRRLFRKGVHHFICGDPHALIVANRDAYIMADREVTPLGALHGSRPLKVCEVDGNFYYGEYRSNRERSSVHVWKMSPRVGEWRPVWRFEGIRHVHGVFHDPFENSIWVTTGDHDHEAGIWRTDNEFLHLERIVGGSQKFRAVELLFTEDHVYFGSDAPDDKNYIFRMDRDGSGVETLAAVGSSVFHGCKVGRHLFFSTAVEPSSVNTTRYAEVWGSADGSNWKLIRKFKKDIWPMKYFQYGQVLFPTGMGDGKNLWLSPFATEWDQRTIRVPLGEL